MTFSIVSVTFDLTLFSFKILILAEIISLSVHPNGKPSFSKEPSVYEGYLKVITGGHVGKAQCLHIYLPQFSTRYVTIVTFLLRITGLVLFSLAVFAKVVSK